LIKLALVTPGENFTGGFFDSFLDVFAHGIRQCEIHHVREYSADIYNVRELSARKVVDLYDYDYMLWIDSDMTFTWDDIVRMVEVDVPIVSGVALIGPYRSNASIFRVDEKGESVIGNLNGWRLDEMPKNEKGLVECDMVGFGFLMFKKGVFEALPRPWFTTGDVVAPCGKHLLASEDTRFTWKCKQAGFPLYVHPDVLVGHQKRQTYKVVKDECQG
jgi:hypothetical protein